MTVRVLTDSTACLPPEVAARAGVSVLPLHVLVGRRTLAEGVDVTSAEVAELLRAGKEPVSTSSPAPGEVVERYRALAAEPGCTGIVSVHLSGRVSGTVETARLAARAVREEVTVEVVDSRVLGMAMGFAACAAAEVAAGGGSLDEVARAAGDRAAASHTFFVLDTLEYLRRGGRVGAAQSLLASALAIKPLLTLADGQVEPLERVRTRSRALARLEEYCSRVVDGASEQGRTVELAVHHLAAVDRAEGLREQLAAAHPEAATMVVELGAVTAVHTGPGTLAVAVSPRP